MVGIKHEHAPAGSDSSLTSREQRAMLFCPNYLFIHMTRETTKKKNGERMAMMMDNDGGAPEND